MGMEDVFSLRVVVTFIAAGVVVVVAFALIRSVISGGKRVVWEIVRVAACLACVLLGGLSRYGKIGPWGAWIGFGGLFVLLLIALIVDRSKNKATRKV
jgi:hypothetical protein